MFGNEGVSAAEHEQLRATPRINLQGANQQQGEGPRGPQNNPTSPISQSEGSVLKLEAV